MGIQKLAATIRKSRPLTRGKMSNFLSLMITPQLLRAMEKPFEMRSNMQGPPETKCGCESV